MKVAKKEISRFIILNFFIKIFSFENNDLLIIIESLKSLLDLSIQLIKTINYISSKSIEVNDLVYSFAKQFKTFTNAKLLEILYFLNRNNLHLRFFLWQRLRNVYQIIYYLSQILFCNLRNFALIINYLISLFYINNNLNNRYNNLFR